MSTTLQEPQLQEQQREVDQNPSPVQTQDTEAGDEEQESRTEDKSHEEEKSDEKDDTQGGEKSGENEQEQTDEKVKTPAKAVSSGAQRTPLQTKATATTATKRKFDALHARSSAAEPSISEHEKNKKARASALMKSPVTRVNAAAKKVTKTREFSFARPTMSSTNRAEAAALDHAQAKARTRPVPPPIRKPLHAKHTPAKTYHAATPGPKTPAADKASRAHFSYTPYTGPLPPLTVESSFAPKGSQMHAASPAWKTAGSAARKPRPAAIKKTSTGKENTGVNADGGAATNDATSSSKRLRTPVKSSSVNKEENRSAFKEKVKAQHSLTQQAARATPTASTEVPTLL